MKKQENPTHSALVHRAWREKNHERLLANERARRARRAEYLREYAKKYAQICRKNGRYQEYHTNYREKNKDKIRTSYMLKRYGITVEQKREIWETQEKRCAVCSVELQFESSHLDHNHQTGKVRGILCGSCNRALGCLKDCPDRIYKLYTYALQHSE